MSSVPSPFVAAADQHVSPPLFSGSAPVPSANDVRRFFPLQLLRRERREYRPDWRARPKTLSAHGVVASSSPDPLFLLPAADVDSDSDARSTPSDCYDENAENIDPNGEVEGSERRSTRPRPMNILCDSEFYPIADPDLAEEEMVVDELIPSDDEDPSSPPIAAPIPLPYTARSKDVLASMISRGPTAAEFSTTKACSSAPLFEEPEPTDGMPIFSSNSDLPSTDDSSSSGASMDMVESPHIAIRPVSPATLVMLTEPVLMKWTEELV